MHATRKNQINLNAENKIFTWMEKAFRRDSFYFILFKALFFLLNVINNKD